MNAISIKNLKYRYPGTKVNALSDINLEISKGEFIGLIGKNGSGKSTLAQALLGIVPNFYKGLYAGEVIVCGINVAEASIDDLSEKIGLVFQNPFNQVTGAKETVYEEIAFGLENFGVPRDEMKKRIDNCLALLDIQKYKDRSPFDLSGGQMQRVAIASIIAMNPEIIILDEPTSQLDPQGSEDVFKAVKKLSESGITIILVSHKMEKLAQYSDRIILLDNGHLLAFDTPEKIFSQKGPENTPIYTKVSQSLNIKNGDYFPVTLDSTKECFDAYIYNRNK